MPDDAVGVSLADARQAEHVVSPIQEGVAGDLAELDGQRPGQPLCSKVSKVLPSGSRDIRRRRSTLRSQSRN